MSKAHTTSSAEARHPIINCPRRHGLICESCDRFDASGEEVSEGELASADLTPFPAMGKSSKGPWFFDKMDENSDYISIRTLGGGIVAAVFKGDYGDGSTGEGNADLCLAAPTLKAENEKLKESNAELLEACENLLKAIKVEADSKEYKAAIILLDAISKAKGE